MLTKQDQKFLLKNFATKKDIKGVAKQKNLISLSTKVNSIDIRLTSVEQKVTELTEFMVPAIGNLLQWTDDVHRAIVGKPTRHVS